MRLSKMTQGLKIRSRPRKISISHLKYYFKQDLKPVIFLVITHKSEVN